MDKGIVITLIICGTIAVLSLISSIKEIIINKEREDNY